MVARTASKALSISTKSNQAPSVRANRHAQGHFASARHRLSDEQIRDIRACNEKDEDDQRSQDHERTLLEYVLHRFLFHHTFEKKLDSFLQVCINAVAWRFGGQSLDPLLMFLSERSLQQLLDLRWCDTRSRTHPEPKP
jgi:hypothetical protein